MHPRFQDYKQCWNELAHALTGIPLAHMWERPPALPPEADNTGLPSTSMNRE